MINLGTVKPGSTIRIPFSSFDKDDGSSITMTNFAAADILVYKDGSTTERASTAGFTATTDFDTKTGKHLAIIDLADNTTSGFYTAGSEYLVAIDSVTVDAVTTGGWIARFVIGYPDADLNTTIATLSSQTSFTLTAGPAEDDALNGCVVAIHDIASAVQMGYAVVSDYTGSTRTVTLTAGVTFTAAAGDNISIFPPGNARWFAALLGVALPLTPTTAGRTLDVSAGGEAGIDWANIGSPTTAVNLSGTNIDTDQVVASVTGAVGSVTAAVSANVTQISGDSVAADNAEAFFDGTGYAGTNNVIPTVTTVTNLHASAATAAELAKVPKSDGTATWNATALASIQSEANDALVAYDAATGTDVTTAAANVSVDEIQATALADLFNTDSGTTYASAVAGSVVKEIADNAGGSALTEAGIADAVWDELLSGHAVSGSAGEALSAAGTAGDPWTTALPGAYGSGTAGNIIGNNLNATVSSRATQTSVDTIDDLLDTEVAALTAELAKVPKSDGTATWNATALASLQQEATDALNAYDPPTRAELTTDTNSVLTAVGDVPTNAELATALAGADDAVLAAIAALNNLSAAQVNAEVVDALATDTYAEPGQGTPAATASISAKLGYLYKAFRNKSEQTATQYSLYNDDALTVDHKASVSDNGTTLTRGEVATGP